MKKILKLFMILIPILLISFMNIEVKEDDVSDSRSVSSKGINIIPWPKEIVKASDDLVFSGKISIVLDKSATEGDLFIAKELISDLMAEYDIIAELSPVETKPAIFLTHKQVPRTLARQGYMLTTNNDQVVIRSGSEEGLFYGTQTLLQIINKNGINSVIPGVSITDWPDIEERAIHYDTKHHQDKASYVKAFIKDLSRYKVNILVWEWEDKFAYTGHPEIGAPGAFTMKEMQEFTEYARKYHIQIVPLVQGLGHVSFILKWPQYSSLRELPASNWEFCPLKQGSYDLLFSLWNEAIEATPGSKYLHIGSDETYEIGACENCSSKVEEIGKSGLYQLFVNKSADFLRTKNRNVMVWEPPMGWEKSESPARGLKPSKGLIFTESYDYETPDFTYSRQARKLGHKVFAYDPNPGVVPLMVPYIFEVQEGISGPGSLEKSYRFLISASGSKSFDGMICTSWDDDDLHNQMWMMHFINAAACSWNSNQPGPDDFRNSFFNSYYGAFCSGMDSLFRLLNEGAYYYAGTLERNVWHYGEIGKTRIPDLPRGDALEYDPFWNTEYSEKLVQSEKMICKMNTVLEIIDRNKNVGVKHLYDFEIFRTSAELIKHTCLTYKDLSNFEYAIRNAHNNRFTDYNIALGYLIEAQNIIESSIRRRDSVFNDLVKVYEQTRLPKGMSTPDKQYFWRQDRARHFAQRRPDMSFLIYDEQKLNLEGYLEELKKYISYFKLISQE